MRKSVLVRFLGLFGLYVLIFMALVSLQFTKNGNFSLRVFNLLVEGRYRSPDKGESLPHEGASPLGGGVSVFYGGLEFLLPGDLRSSPAEALYLLDEAGERRACFPRYMTVEERGIRFYLSGGVDISFSAAGEGMDLWISGNFEGDLITGLEIPYRLLRNSRFRNTESGRFLVFAEGRDYQFNRAAVEGRNAVVLQRGGPPISYSPVEEKEEWWAGDYILEEAETPGVYREHLARWVDKNYSLWGRLVPSRNEEDLVIAYGGEALLRGAFRGALSSASRVFTSGSRQAYESSVYMGGMGTAYRGLAAAEAEQFARISHGLDESSLNFLLDADAFEFLALRGQWDLMNRGIALIRTNTPTLAQLPGFLEAQTVLLRRRSRDLEDAADSLAARQRDLLAEVLRYVVLQEPYAGALVLAFEGGRADTELNLKLGKALADWGEAAGQETWGAIGRSIVLSVLSLEDGEGRIVSSLVLNDQRAAPEDNRAYLSAARLYRLLQIGDYRPKALAIGPEGSGLWAWTASPEIRYSGEGQALDITVRFPPGESHYILIRGIDPVSQLQFYGTDWRSDPNFERYDSSGWAYHSGERILALKIKHRAELEHIRIYIGAGG
jgi:hypothetical protein